ncbi:MAG: hypothetical protein HY286_03530 [Planctomycetes bacterium]|nr:hypothetical protein [Planctomycetota bacterium]
MRPRYRCKQCDALLIGGASNNTNESYWWYFVWGEFLGILLLFWMIVAAWEYIFKIKRKCPRCGSRDVVLEPRRSSKPKTG